MSCPTYFLAPNFDFRPNGTIRLGNIMADPLNPRRVLSSLADEEIEVRYPRIERTSDTSRETVKGKAHNMSAGIWARFSEVVRGSISGSRDAQTLNEFSMESITTEYFIHDPEPAEIALRVAEPRVKGIMARSLFSRGQPVFLITGLKIAKGFDFRRQAWQQASASADVGAKIAPQGEASMGANIGGAASANESDRWSTSEEVVFAYEVLKIASKGFGAKKQPHVDSFVPQSAFLGLDDADTDDDEEGEYVGEIEVCYPVVEDIHEDVAKDVATLVHGDVSVNVISLAWKEA